MEKKKRITSGRKREREWKRVRRKAIEKKIKEDNYDKRKNE